MLSLSYTDFTVMPPASSRWAQRPLGRSIWRFVRLGGGEILSAICFLAHSGNWPTLNLQNTTNCHTTCQDLTVVLVTFQSPGCDIVSLSLDASSLSCFMLIRSEWVRQNTTVFVSYLLCWWWHVSATVGHLQVTQIYSIRTLSNEILLETQNWYNNSCSYNVYFLLIIYFCDPRMAHGGRNVSSA